MIKCENRVTFDCRHIGVGVVLLALIANPAAAQWTATGQAVPSLATFDTTIQTFMQDRDITSGALAVTYQGRLVLARGYSWNPAVDDIIVQPDSLFRIASISKPLTGTLVHRLIELGQISLSDTIDEYLDLSPPAGGTADERLATITVRNLLEHLAGFGVAGTIGYDPMFYDASIATALGVDLPVSQSEIATYMNGVDLVTDPGTTYAYSNYGYLLLGRIIEEATGTSYISHARSVLREIGIWDMTLARSLEGQRLKNEVSYDSIYSGTSVMDTSGVTLPYPYGAMNLENMDSAGGWVASAVELARWLANLDDPTADDALLDQMSVDRLFGLPENYSLPYSLGDYFYASGWAVRDYGNGERNTWHNGSLSGTTAFVLRSRYGWNYAALFNRRQESTGTSYSSDLDGLMWGAYSSITTWPAHDLFPTELAILKDGFEEGDLSVWSQVVP